MTTQKLYCDYCGEDNTEIQKHHGDNICNKCLSYEDEEYGNCKGCKRLQDRGNICGHGIADGICCICEECRKELLYNNGEYLECEECKEEVTVNEDEECPTTCINCDKIYHANCMKGNIRYIEKEGEDYCYNCKSHGESDDEEEEDKDISKLTVKQLKTLCKERGLKRYSGLRKQELLDLLK